VNDPVKYTFDQAFDGGAQNRFDLEVQRLQTEIETTRTESHAAGVEDGRAQMRAEIEAATHSLVEQLITKVEAMFQLHHDIENRVIADMGFLAYMVADKLALSFRDHIELSGVDSLVEECLKNLHTRPNMRVYVNPAIADGLRAKVDEISEKMGYDGAVTVVADEKFGMADCALRWGDGGLERDQARVESEIKDRVSEFLRTAMKQAERPGEDGGV